MGSLVTDGCSLQDMKTYCPMSGKILKVKVSPQNSSLTLNKGSYNWCACVLDGCDGRSMGSW